MLEKILPNDRNIFLILNLITKSLNKNENSLLANNKQKRRVRGVYCLLCLSIKT